jgi:hypothetical protein
MRTVPFIDVFNGVLTRHGLDPLAGVPQTKSRAIVRHINRRVRTGLRYWDWPEWSITEERAFRQTWSSTRQFRIIGENAKPDEVFLIDDGSGNAVAQYFRVKKDAPGDPPVGTRPIWPIPTDPDPADPYWEQIVPLDTYIAFDQVCKKPMGMVLGVYGLNPRLNPTYEYSAPLDYRSSEKGIDVCDPVGPTVFVWYQIPVPIFTIVPWIDGKTYVRGNIVFDPESGDCFRCVGTSTTNPVSDAANWTRQSFPEVLASYCEAGAFADSMMELPQGEGAKPDPALATAAGQEALESLCDEINVQIVNGQRHYYGYGMRYHGVWGITTSQPWPGGWVTTLTEECDVGGYFPPPITFAMPISEYGDTIVSIDGPAEPALTSLATALRAVRTLEVIVIDVGGTPQEQSWRLDPGTADPADPGQAQPRDWNLATNNKKWIRVG